MCRKKKRGRSIQKIKGSTRENLLELHARDIIVLITARINTKKKNGFYRPVHPSHERESVGCQDRKLEATTFREIGFANFERDLRVQRRNGRPKTRDVFVRGTPLEMFFFFVFLSAIRLQNSLFSSSKRDDDASLSFRKSKNPTSMRTLDRSDERAFARDDKILEAINIDFERTGLKRAAAAADRNFCSRICSSFCESFLGGKTRFYLSYPPISSLGESSLANKNLTKCISRNPPF